MDFNYINFVNNSTNTLFDTPQSIEKFIDRKYIHKEMPLLDNYLNYRMIDVSSIKEVIKRWYEPSNQEPQKKNMQREECL